MIFLFIFDKIFEEGEKMNFIDSIKERARSQKKKIVLPETMDERVIEAAVMAKKEGIADIILVGKPIKDISLEEIEVIIPETDSKTEELANALYELRKEKGMTLEKAKELL